MGLMAGTCSGGHTCGPVPFVAVSASSFHKLSLFSSNPEFACIFSTALKTKMALV